MLGQWEQFWDPRIGEERRGSWKLQGKALPLQASGLPQPLCLSGMVVRGAILMVVKFHEVLSAEVAVVEAPQGSVGCLEI